MSDFFTHLVERTLGTASLIQPLLAPRFAPASEMAEPVEALAIRSEALPEASSMRSVLPDIATPIERQPESITHPGVAPTGITNDPFINGQELPIIPTSQPEMTKFQPTTITEPQHTSQEPQPVSAPLERIILATRKELAAVSPAQAITLLSPPPEEHLATPSNSPAPSMLATRKSQTLSTPPLQVSTHSATQRPVVPEQVAHATIQTPPALATPAAEPTSAQIIHVNIGRIEVRAVQAAASSTTTARPAVSRSAAVLSLDEYLKRAGGSR